jgi:hypothetical protein
MRPGASATGDALQDLVRRAVAADQALDLSRLRHARGGPYRLPARGDLRDRLEVALGQQPASAITITGSQSEATKSMWCSTTSTVMPSSRRWAMWRAISAASVGFTPATGSSSSSSFGSAIRARPDLQQLLLAARQRGRLVVQHAREVQPRGDATRRRAQLLLPAPSRGRAGSRRTRLPGCAGP